MADRRCPECNGAGIIVISIGRRAECPTCDGTGIIGNPGCIMAYMVITAMLVIGAILWLIFGGRGH